MILTVSIAAVTVIGMIVSVLKKPYIRCGKSKIGLYWLITFAGAALILITGCLSVSDAWDKITADSAVNPIKILILFISMTLLSVFLGDAGFFDYIADRIFLKSGKSRLKLFIVLYIAVSILTIFTSNDIIILTFTPPICIFAKRARISAVPYLFGEFVAANTWSMTLIVGNPTNIYLATAAGIGFTEYFSVMWFPALAGGLAGLAALLLLFRKNLTRPLSRDGHEGHASIKIDKFMLITALIHLSLCIILLAVSDFINIEMYLICLILAASLLLISIVYGLVKDKSLHRAAYSLKKAPYELIPFVLSMFVIVSALTQCGFTQTVGNALLTGNKTDGVTFSFLSAAAANLLNNIPMSVFFESICSGNISALYGSVIGSNIGAFITPVGALAGIMWSKILSRYGVRMRFSAFVFYGLCAALPALAASSAALLVML